MEIVLLGTAGGDGWPNPFCGCRSCARQRELGEIRGQSAALVDGVLLIDCGPEVPRAAERLGYPLTGVRTLLLTHGHPDHTGPAALLWRHWAGRAEPLQVVGPAAALAACRPWVAPADPVRWCPVTAGDRLEAGDYLVRVHAADHDRGSGPPVLYDLTAADGARLLYATDTGPLPAATRAAVAGAGFDVVLLEETCGESDGRELGHLDLETFPAELAELRRTGAVTSPTRVAAIHLGHRNPPATELARRLGTWGVELPVDGAVLRTPGRGAVGGAASPSGRRVLITGGARSGKSVEAERRLAAEPEVTYLATARPRPDDPEWAARLAEHRARRPRGWRTVESTDLAGTLRRSTGPLLIDDIGLWLTAVVDDLDAWSGARADEVRAAAAEVAAAWRSTRAVVVAVTNEVGSGVVPASPAGRLFRDELGRLNAALAAAADEVVHVVAGIATRLR